MARIIQLLFVTLWLVCYQASALVTIPDYSRRIVDTTGTLTSTQITQLENKVIQYETNNNNGSQIAVLLIATLDGESIEQYATRVFEHWQIGQKESNNGVLLLIAKDDRAVRIEVGYGLEGDLPDLTAKRIIDQYIVVAFKQDNYYQGIDNSLTTIINILNHSAQNELDPVDRILTMKDIFNDEFATTLLNYAGISFIICFFIGHIFPLLAFKKSIGRRSLVTGLFNGISTAGFTFFKGFPMTVVLPTLFLTLVASTILCAIFSINRSGSGSFRGPRGGSGGGFGGSHGGFGGGGGGRSGGGGASGRW